MPRLAGTPAERPAAEPGLPPARADTSPEQRCVACGAQAEDLAFVRVGGVALHACPRCGTRTALPRPAPAEQRALHERPDYFDHPYFEARRGSEEAHDWLCRFAFERLAGIDAPEKLAGARVVDVGCDTGGFLAAAARLYGVSPFGIDVAPRALAAAGTRVHLGTLETAPAELCGVDVVTAFDLVEHLADPLAFLVEARRRLAPGGLLLVQTPNADSLVYAFGAGLARRRLVGQAAAWLARLFPPEHVQYFTRSGLERLARRAQLEPVRVLARRLRPAELHVSPLVRLGIAGLQLLDHAAGREILLCGAFRRNVDGR